MAGDVGEVLQVAGFHAVGRHPIQYVAQRAQHHATFECRTVSLQANARGGGEGRGLVAVADVRQAGMMLAFELTLDGDKATPFPTAARVGLKAYRAALERGVVLRPLGDVLYWMPPYCVEPDDLQLLADVTRHAIDEATACA